MGIDVGGNTITQASSVLTINTGVNMLLRSADAVVRPRQTMFQAVSNPAGGWVYWTTEQVWNKLPFTSMITNTNSCFDTANARFTAPVTGMYFFQACAYLLKDNASDSYYWHPMFAVNGTVAGGSASGSPYYRIRGYGIPIASYEDGQLTGLYLLNAGDYVEYFMYSNGGWNASTGNRYHAAYVRFTGFLLG